ncbi:MAG: L-rhamnose mutarotase [Clostridiales bacterium]|nr:L-rhamnose mutarotase [Clostridiales bacterium]
MERIAFALKILPGRIERANELFAKMAGRVREDAKAAGIANFSVWGVEDMVFAYGEYPDGFSFEGEFGGKCACWMESLSDCAELFCAPRTMRLMYHDYGIVREDKGLIRHRVFATKLKPGCEEEYKRRHDGLIEARGDTVSEGPDSNFSIWHGKGYIFGYCEKVKSFDREMTEEEKASTIAWETRQLEIMDWLTDDVDWITGEKHEAIRRII